MAANVKVIDSSMRQHIVKVVPGKYMTEVLEEACKKLGYNPSNYSLKYKEKPLDLSRTYRQTGLVSGAKLELVQASRTPSAVSIALGLPDGGRLTDKVPSDTTLWLILRKLESSGGLTGMANYNFTARGAAKTENGASGAGRIFYEMPTVNVAGRELSTFADLQKTLAQLGINGGSALIRLNFKKTEQPLEEAMAEIGKYFKEEEAPVKVTPPEDVEGITEAIHKLDSHSEGELKDVDMTSGVSEATTTPADPSPYPETVGDLPPPITPSKRAAEDTPSPEQQQVLGPNHRPISVYRPPSGQVPLAATIPHNESDFEPSITHAKMHQDRLKTESHNKRLLSDAEVERAEKEREARLGKTKNVSIKVRFPDQSSIVAPFTALDTGAHFHTFVRGVIVAEDQPFKLVWNADKGVQTVPNNEKKLIKDLGLERGVLVNFHWDDDARESVRKQTILKPQYAQNAKDVSVPEIPSVDAGEDDRTSEVKEEKPKGSGDGKKKGMPAWFKGLAKK
ncbi:related to UBX domain protein [Phialocephala subalpina]|uniref:Related to UBX domain protein n=1 Tax=Phialocephala subalpina TaxID=576137 RepID=A0A1L7WEJ3_9HELO|nr:related to UBX domain protein [Phialocephala subalpina]